MISQVSSVRFLVYTHAALYARKVVGVLIVGRLEGSTRLLYYQPPS